MLMPSSIQVGPFRFTVNGSADAVVRARTHARDQRMGECDSRMLAILVDPTTPFQQQQDTLLHEVLHACWYVSGGYEKDMDEDTAVGRQTSIILDTLRRNPDLVAYLLAEG